MDLHILANVHAYIQMEAHNVKPSRFGAPLRRDKPIKSDSRVLSKFCLCVKKISLPHFLSPHPSLLPVICGS